jgi:hypothetical protein
MSSNLFFSRLSFFLIAGLIACSGTSPTQSQPSIAVSLTAPITSVQAGKSVQLTASVSNASNTAVIWEVNGIPGGNSTSGTITSSGLYTAPLVQPNPATVVILAAAAADTSASAVVNLTIGPPVVVAITPKAVTVLTGSTYTFASTVANASDKSVSWFVNGIQGGNSTFGTISTVGLYAAPPTPPASSTVSVTAASNADTTKSDTASVTIAFPPAIVVSVSPSNSALQTGTSEQFSATVVNASTTAVIWKVAGVTGGNPTVGLISASGFYSAPSAVPDPATVIISAVSQADQTVNGTATVTLSLAPPPVSVTLSPKTANVQISRTQQFSATVDHAMDTFVSWQVNNIRGGNASLGTISNTGVYTAPAAVPQPATVQIEAVSNEDPSKSDSAAVTITPAISVSVTPMAMNLIPNQSQQFTANVSNSSNQSVTWSISGANCSGAGCGMITQADNNTPGGSYMAPATIPGPDPTVLVTATSVADPSISAVATVTITPAPTPTVQISGPTPAGPIVLNSRYTYTAIVSIDPKNQGVAWTLVCTGDNESAPFGPDCANSEDSDGDGDNFTLDQMSETSVVLVTPNIVIPNPGDSTESYRLNLTATSIAIGSDGSHGSATVTITVLCPSTTPTLPCRPLPANR